ncbi:MAG: hypothetical protein WCG98_00095 [bacterium]
MVDKMQQNTEVLLPQTETDKLKKDVVDNNLDQLQVKTDILKLSTEKTMTLIKKSSMLSKLQSLETKYQDPTLSKEALAGFKVEDFATNINKPVVEFLCQSFCIDNDISTLKISHEVLATMSVGIQFAMMETFQQSGAQGEAFFSQFSQTETSTISGAFSGLMKSFG